MEVIFKYFVTIRGSYTQQGLSNRITFRPIKSGATVPLSGGVANLQVLNLVRNRMLNPCRIWSPWTKEL
jgi:hypothetical protein